MAQAEASRSGSAALIGATFCSSWRTPSMTFAQVLRYGEGHANFLRGGCAGPSRAQSFRAKARCLHAVRRPTHAQETCMPDCGARTNRRSILDLLLGAGLLGWLGSVIFPVIRY